MDVLDAPILIYFGLLFVFFVVSFGAFIGAVLINSFSPVQSVGGAAVLGYNTSITLYQEIFGFFDKSFPVLMLLVMLMGMVLTIRHPSVDLGIGNLVVFFLVVFLMAKLQPVVSNLSVALQTAQLLPNETAFFDSSYGSYTVLIFSAVFAILNFNGAARHRNRPVMDVNYHEHPQMQ